MVRGKRSESGSHEKTATSERWGWPSCEAAATFFGITAARRFPVLVGDVVSTLGTDPVFLRYRNLTPSSAELFLQEEQSLDNETSHLLEDVSLFVAE